MTAPAAGASICSRILPTGITTFPSPTTLQTGQAGYGNTPAVRNGSSVRMATQSPRPGAAPGFGVWELGSTAVAASGPAALVVPPRFWRTRTHPSGGVFDRLRGYGFDRLYPITVPLPGRRKNTNTWRSRTKSSRCGGGVRFKGMSPPAHRRELGRKRADDMSDGPRPLRGRLESCSTTTW